MDTAYAKLGIPFDLALAVVATVIHANPKWSVADCGLKALGMDHGNPTIDGADVMFCSDEHVTFVPSTPVRVGDRVLVWPAHVDPTVAYHDSDAPGRRAGHRRGGDRRVGRRPSRLERPGIASTRPPRHAELPSMEKT